MATIKEHVLKIGSKGEIFPPKEIREMLGLEKDQQIILTIQNDLLIIRKVYSVEELLAKPAKVKISMHAWKQFRKQLAKDAEK